LTENKSKLKNEENDKKILELNIEICKLKSEIEQKDKHIEERDEAILELASVIEKQMGLKQGGLTDQITEMSETHSQG
jgi:hypothetical protein